jgi:hypothetical protein
VESNHAPEGASGVQSRVEPGSNCSPWRKGEDSNLTPREAARIAFQASSVPDGFPFHGLDGRNRTCNLSAPNRALFQIEPHPGVVPVGGRGGPSANRTQCGLLIREPRVTNPSWPEVMSPTAATIAVRTGGLVAAERRAAWAGSHAATTTDPGLKRAPLPIGLRARGTGREDRTLLRLFVRQVLSPESEPRMGQRGRNRTCDLRLPEPTLLPG